jgi:uracil-DNA glycosylase
MCRPPDDRAPTDEEYAAMEPFFDAELRAITAHVLLPVGARATEHVLGTYTSRPVVESPDMDELHGQELRGAGWFVVPIADPSGWDRADADRLVERLQAILESDYRQASDLGRFLAGNNPYFVR